TLPPPARRETKFLALDKCLPRRQFLEESLFFFLVDSSSEASFPYRLSTSPQRKMPYLSREREPAVYPDPDSARAAVAREWDWVHAHALPKLVDECRVDAVSGCARCRWCAPANECIFGAARDGERRAM
ncbi:hypothetical protein EI94DRAFT_1748387, partial [Lactarius quietus]